MLPLLRSEIILIVASEPVVRHILLMYVTEVDYSISYIYSWKYVD